MKKLRRIVEQGGNVISEGLPAYFGDHGRAGRRSQTMDWIRLFGARESYVEFTPDLLEKLTFEVQGQQIDGRYFLQEYETDRRPRRRTLYERAYRRGGEQSRKGRTLLIGTFPGGGYFGHHTPAGADFLCPAAEVRRRRAAAPNQQPRGAGSAPHRQPAEFPLGDQSNT